MYATTATSTFNYNSNLYNIADWRTATSQDANSIYSNPVGNINGVPTATGGHNLGPAVDTVIYDDTDFRGITRNAPYDLGAFESATGIRVK
jgi:hypothetical protein